jgi:hypothetical protein
MEHRIVFAILAVVGCVLAQIHIFHVERHEAAIATLNALPEFNSPFV